MISSTRELWREFSSLARFEDTAYDNELKKSIINSLNLQSENIELELNNSKVSVEELLSAILDTLKPFSQMMTDLLSLYKSAGATSNNNNIEIEFDFDDETCKFSLDAFRKHVEGIQKITEIRNRLLDPWKLIRFIDQFDKGQLNNSISPRDYYGKGVYRWLNEYQRDKLPRHLPEFPPAHDKRLNSSLKRIIDLVEGALQCYIKEYSPSEGRKRCIDKGCKKYGTDLWWAETDHWLARFVKDFYSMTIYFHNMEYPASMPEVSRKIDEFLHNPGVVDYFTVERQIRAIYDILSLPFWKHRYEMYSAWVFTCITEAVSDLGIVYNVVDGVLQFKFSGALLATVYLPDSELEIWAELKHPAIDPKGKGRTNNIQPDYSIVRKRKDAFAPCCLIECKQYKRSNNNNFADAVNDYAHACPKSKVFLVNYGRISKNLTSRFETDVRNRYSGYGIMRPSEPERNRFIQDLRENIGAEWVSIQKEQNRDVVLWEDIPEQIKIELSWERQPRDMDLRVDVNIPDESKTYIIDYRNKGSENTYPYVSLKEDILEGPGTETCTVHKTVSGCYDIYVNNYSGEEEIEGAICVKASAGYQTVESYNEGIWEKGHQWHVGQVNSLGVSIIKD